MTINGIGLTDADRIRFHIEAETHEDEYYEVRRYLPPVQIAAAPPPGPRPPRPSQACTDAATAARQTRDEFDARIAPCRPFYQPVERE